MQNLTLPVMMASITSSSLIDSDLIGKIADNGIMVVIGAIVIGFLAKVLNIYVEKDKTITNSILPKMTEILKDLTSIRIAVVETISSHNMSTNKKFVELTSEMDAIKKNTGNINDALIRTDERLDTMAESLTEIKTMLTMMNKDKKDSNES